MREKAEAVMRANKDCMSDHFSTIRNGHVCIPVKKEYKFKISGILIDKSSTGSTLFIEPSASAKYYEELDILKRVTNESLVVMDELGSGTDPAEGMGIAIAILEELKKSGALFLVTTHYPEVKVYAEQEEGIVNARMTFDRENLKPLYQMVIGEAGESCAFYIAGRLGMPAYMLQRAAREAYGERSGQTPEFGENGKAAKSGFSEAGGNEAKGSIPAAGGNEAKRSIPAAGGNEAKRSIPAAGTDAVKSGSLPVPHIIRAGGKTGKKHGPAFQRGDSVMIYPDKKIGIVCEPTNDKGALRVQLPDRKIWINHKRVKLQVAAEELYPEDYDFSIIFDTVENRKLRHRMERKHVEGAEIAVDSES